MLSSEAVFECSSNDNTDSLTRTPDVSRKFGGLGNLCTSVPRHYGAKPSGPFPNAMKFVVKVYSTVSTLKPQPFTYLFFNSEVRSCTQEHDTTFSHH